MRLKPLVAAVVACAVLASATIAVAVPGALDPPADSSAEPEPTGRLAVTELTITPGDVSGATAHLRVTPFLAHRGGASENVSLLVRAIDDGSGLVESTERVSLATVTGDREVSANATLAVPREGGYRVEAVVYRDGKRVRTASKDVSNVAALEPGYEDSPLAFHEFDRPIPVVQYGVADAGPDRVALNVSTFLTNRGSAPAGDLRVTLVARQNGSNVVADRTTVAVGTVRAGRTVTPHGRLTVPDDYNYYLDAVLTRDGVVVDTARSTANLEPTTGLTVNDSEADDSFQTGDFQSDESPDDDADPRRTTVEEDAGSGGSGPGFGVGVAALGVLLLALGGLARRNA